MSRLCYLKLPKIICFYFRAISSLLCSLASITILNFKITITAIINVFTIVINYRLTVHLIDFMKTAGDQNLQRLIATKA